MDRALDSDSKGRWFESSRAYQSRQGTRRRMERFCDGFLAAFNGGNGGKCCKICKMGTTDQAQTACLCPCGKLSCFYGAMRSFLWTRGSEKLALFPFLPESFLEDDLLWFIRYLGPAALRPAGAPTTIFTPVPGGGYRLSIPYLAGFPPQIQFSAQGTGKAVFYGVVFHVLNAAHLFAKLAYLSSFGHCWWAL